MKVRSWLSTCSFATSGHVDAITPSPPPPKSPLSDTQTTSSSASSSTSTSNSSIQTSVSILTLPSVPSLQKLVLSIESPGNPSATVALLTSLTHRATVNFLVLHNNLLYTATGNQVHVYETMHNTFFGAFNVENPSSGSVKAISFQYDKIFTAHQDCKVRVWKLNDRRKHYKLVTTIPTLEDRLRRFILPQNYIRVRRHKKKLWIEHHDTVSGLASFDNNNLVASISWDKSIKIWRADNFQCLESINKAHDDAINAIVVSSDGLIYTGSADKRIKAWKRENKKYEVIATLEKHKSAVNALALDGTGSILFSGSCDRSILVWEREDSANHMAVVGALRGHAKAILCLIYVQDLLLSGSGDRTVRIWRRGFDGRYCCLAVLDGHRTPVRSLAAVPVEERGDGLKVFSGSFDGEIRVWKVEVSSTFDNS